MFSCGDLMVHVKLITYNGVNIDPRRLVLLAIKTSTGGIKERGLDHYISRYPEEDVSKWLIESVKFPSVLEHVTFTFLIDDISRVTSHQLVRHRLASFTQESQRYSAASEDYVMPVAIKKGDFEERVRSLIGEAYKLYKEMLDAGIPYEDARYVLPQAITTRILMTVNLRELIHIACLRLSPHAQWEIREVAKKMIEEASRVIPELPKMIEEGCKRGL
jgi:thymidylate synthase (FAD)